MLATPNIYNRACFLINAVLMASKPFADMTDSGACCRINKYGTCKCYSISDTSIFMSYNPAGFPTMNLPAFIAPTANTSLLVAW